MRSTAAGVREVSGTGLQKHFIFKLAVRGHSDHLCHLFFCRKQLTTFHAIICSIACLKLDQLLGFWESKITLMCFHFRGSFKNTDVVKKDNGYLTQVNIPRPTHAKKEINPTWLLTKWNFLESRISYSGWHLSAQ